MEEFGDITFRRLPTRSSPGAMNMALDAVAAETAAAGGPATVRVYGWEPSTLTLGYAQDPDTIDWAFCDEAGIAVTRRPTGGGAIYHDTVGDISYSIVVPRENLPDDLTASYQLLCRPLVSAFETLGIPVDFAETEREAVYQPACYLRGLHPAHDLVVDSPAGERKISGNAQHRQRDAVVQHGSILYDIPAERHLACFRDSAVSTDTVHHRTTSVTEHTDVSRGDVIVTLEGALDSAFDPSMDDWTAEERDRAGTIVESRFGADEWIKTQPSPEA